MGLHHFKLIVPSWKDADMLNAWLRANKISHNYYEPTKPDAYHHEFAIENSAQKKVLELLFVGMNFKIDTLRVY